MLFRSARLPSRSHDYNIQAFGGVAGKGQFFWHKSLKSGERFSCFFDSLSLGCTHEMTGLRIDCTLGFDVIIECSLGLVTEIAIFQIDKSRRALEVGSDCTPKNFIVWGVGNALGDIVCGLGFSFGWFLRIGVGIGMGSRKFGRDGKCAQCGGTHGMDEMFSFHPSKIINSLCYWVLMSCKRSCMLVLPLKVFSSMQ